jgi:hypothetical protein
MKIKNVIAGIGCLAMLIGASCDLEYSDPKAVLALIVIGGLLFWYGGKYYEYSEDYAN